MKKMIDAILTGYGTQAVLQREGQAPVTVLAFLQPVTDKSWQTVGSGQALGEMPQGAYIYIGPAEPLPLAGDVVTAGADSFVVMRAETLVVAGESLYTWGLLRKKGGEEPWSS